MEREFRNPERPNSETLEQLLRDGDPRDLAEALIGVALGSDDLVTAFRTVTSPQVTEHVDAGVRGAAVLSLGHLVRIHRCIPEDPTLALINTALHDHDAWVRGQAENALSDIEMYAPEIARAYPARFAGSRHH